MASLTSSSLYFSLIVLCSSLFLLSSSVSALEGDIKVHMNITNDLGSGIPLSVHCKSKNDDIGGWQLLDFHQSLTWAFEPNFFTRNTLFWCNMRWKSATGWVEGSFEVYNEKYDLHKCFDECLYSIRANGAFYFNQETNQYEIRHFWW